MLAVFRETNGNENIQTSLSFVDVYALFYNTS